jgi:hypothetical protein
MHKSKQIEPTITTGITFGLFLPQMSARGIPPGTAYKLLAKGLVETVLIGRRRYVKIASLDSLLDRLARKEVQP